MRKSPAEAEEGAQETEFERFLQESGLNEAQAMGLLRAAYGRQMQLMERAQQVLAAVRAIGDENFTIEALQSNPEAMRALEEGGTVGEIAVTSCAAARTARARRTRTWGWRALRAAS